MSCINRASFEVREVGLSFLQENRAKVVKLVTNAFLQNHEISKYFYQKTGADLQGEYKRLFEDHVVDLMEEIERQKGRFFVVVKKEDNKIIGLSMGRDYGKPALSRDFMSRVFASDCLFKEVMKGWWQLMERYEPAVDEELPGRVYHQAVRAIHPKYVDHSLGTFLTETVLASIAKEGYAAYVTETSSDRSHRSVDKSAVSYQRVDMDTHEVAETHSRLILKVITFPSDRAEPVLEWFKSRKARTL